MFVEGRKIKVRATYTLYTGVLVTVSRCQRSPDPPSDRHHSASRPATRKDLPRFTCPCPRVRPTTTSKLVRKEHQINTERGWRTRALVSLFQLYRPLSHLAAHY
ncbi:hypothetical protein BaRGS_00009873 [Batillaria attramentaria]|uniref:Uncharacterized protein n=1 Tax=Batillaria attramentaria TaxID=370345 RepID=A0ABD0LHV1_9CAEN